MGCEGAKSLVSLENRSVLSIYFPSAVSRVFVRPDGGGHHVDQVVRRDGRVKRFRAIMFPGNRVGLVRYLPPGANHRRAAAGGVVRIRAAQRRQMLTTDALLPQQLA